MALTISTHYPERIGRKKVVRGTMTFDSSYATGGLAFTPKDLGMVTVEEVRAFPSSSGYVGVWNRSVTAPKMQAFYGDNNNAADGPLIEVPAATNISTVTVQFEAIGV